MIDDGRSDPLVAMFLQAYRHVSPKAQPHLLKIAIEVANAVSSA